MPPDYIAQSAHSQLLHRRLTGQILGAFYSVYRELGGGFAENVYEGALARELARLGLKADCQVPIVVHYRNRRLVAFAITSTSLPKEGPVNTPVIIPSLSPSTLNHQRLSVSLILAERVSQYPARDLNPEPTD
jgi:hypothetical protein